jgi:hypothetical protein
MSRVDVLTTCHSFKGQVLKQPLAVYRCEVSAPNRLSNEPPTWKSEMARCIPADHCRKARPLYWIVIVVLLLFARSIAAYAESLGDLSANPFNPNSLANPFGAGSPYAFKSPTNPYGPYGSPFSNRSATNPFATQAPRLYDREGNYRGKLSANPYDPDSISNPFGRYGSPFSPDSVKNPFGAGSPFRFDSPTNPFGSGWIVIGE